MKGLGHFLQQRGSAPAIAVKPANGAPGKPPAAVELAVKQMLGIDLAEMQAWGDNIGKLLEDFKLSLERIETTQNEIVLQLGQIARQLGEMRGDLERIIR